MKTFFAVCFMMVAGQAWSQSGTDLLPVPVDAVLSDGRLRVQPGFSISINGQAGDSLLSGAVDRALIIISRRTGSTKGAMLEHKGSGKDSAALSIYVKSRESFSPGIDESYTIAFESNHAFLKASNSVGALRGLETFLQLLDHDSSGYFFRELNISDRPRFAWRGLMIDVARHFMPVNVLERNIEAMAAVKMNVLHLHLCDDEGFRVESRLFPLLQSKGSGGAYYTQAQIREIVQFAKDRGIMVVPEFDMPGHVQALLAGYPELASLPGPYHPGPRSQWQTEHPSYADKGSGSLMDMVQHMVSPTLDPSREAVYDFIDRFLGEMAGLFPAPYVHIGADENNGMAWKKSPAIAAFMQSKGMNSTEQLQQYFVERIHGIIRKHGRQMIGWEEVYNQNLPKDVLVQKWIPSNIPVMKTHATPAEMAAAGHQVILSEGFYLDLFQPAYIHYTNPAISGQSGGQLLGGEAAIWSEIADPNNLDGRIWPRAAAIAERLWSPKSVIDVDDMYRRLFRLNLILEDRGLRQIVNYEIALRRIVNGEDIGPLKALCDVLTPVKGYRKLIGTVTRPPLGSYLNTPLTNISDIIQSDAEAEIRFRWSLQKYLATQDSSARESLRGYLRQWKDNESLLRAYLPGNPRLMAVQPHSAHLSEAASIGLEALDRMSGRTAPDSTWIREKTERLKAMNKVYGETELSILPDLLALVNGKLEPRPSSFPLF